METNAPPASPQHFAANARSLCCAGAHPATTWPTILPIPSVSASLLPEAPLTAVHSSKAWTATALLLPPAFPYMSVCPIFTAQFVIVAGSALVFATLDFFPHL